MSQSKPEIVYVPETDTSRPRQSRRLQGLAPEVFLEERSVVQEEKNGIILDKRILWDLRSNRQLREIAVKARNVNLDNPHPGRIIKAIHVYPSTDLNATKEDRTIGNSKVAGPIAGKMRYMIVVWRTQHGIGAIPLFTLGEGVHLHPDRWDEFVSVSSNATWAGQTPWAGMPLLMRTNTAYEMSEHCFADLSHVHWLSKEERFYDDCGHIDGGEFSKLIDLLEIKEKAYRDAAFDRFSTATQRERWEPHKAHVPQRGVRFANDKTRRMAKKRFKRV